MSRRDQLSGSEPRPDGSHDRRRLGTVPVLVLHRPRTPLEGPFRLPLFGQAGIAARTDYLVNGPADCMLFLTAAKADGKEGRPLCVRTTDGGKTWKFVSWIAPEPQGFAIMPATVRIDDRELLTAIRRHDGEKHWIETYRSRDDGQSWTLDTIPAPDLGEGNPASLNRLADGRICLVYGFRALPFSMRARLSRDRGHTWENEVILRDDGGGRDMGYPHRPATRRQDCDRLLLLGSSVRSRARTLPPQSGTRTDRGRMGSSRRATHATHAGASTPPPRPWRLDDARVWVR